MKSAPIDSSFDRTVNAYKTVLTGEMARNFRDTMPEVRQLGQLGKRKAFEQAAATINGRFARIKGMLDSQQTIYEEVKRILATSETKELLDVFSGFALVPFSLLASKKVQKMQVVDGRKNINYRAVAEALRIPKQQVQHIQTTINPFFDQDSLPETRQVTLIDTGLSLPGEVRAPNIGIDYATARSSHIPHEPRLMIEDDHLAVLLKLLQDTPRDVLMVDRPHRIVGQTMDDSRERIGAIIAATKGSWHVDMHEQLEDKNLIVTRLSNK